MKVDDERNAARTALDLLVGRSDELVERIERDITDDARMRKPGPGVWSLTEVVQHLSLVAGGMLRTGRPTKRGAPFIGAAKMAALRSLLRSRLKIKAPVAAIVPRPGVTWSDARANLRASNDRWRAFVDGDTFDQLVFKHPLVGRLTPVETVTFLVEHFDHHTRQVDRLLAK